MQKAHCCAAATLRKEMQHSFEQTRAACAIVASSTTKVCCSLQARPCEMLTLLLELCSICELHTLPDLALNGPGWRGPAGSEIAVLEATLSREPSAEQVQDPSVLSMFETPGGHQVIQTLVEAEVGGRMQQFVTRTVVTASGQVVCVVREDNEEVRPSAQLNVCCMQHFVTRTVLTASGQVVCIVREDND